MLATSQIRQNKQFEELWGILRDNNERVFQLRPKMWDIDFQILS